MHRNCVTCVNLLLSSQLIYRMATVLDVKDVNAPRKTRELWKAGSGNHEGRRVGLMYSIRQNNLTALPLPMPVQVKARKEVNPEDDLELLLTSGKGARRERRRKTRTKDGVASSFDDVDMEEVVSRSDVHVTLPNPI